MARILFSILLSYVCITVVACHGLDTSPPKFPAVLIFGDSTVDTGNNNYIGTLFKANHSPYGVDYLDHVATGRFSDGRLVPDMLVSELGIKESLPPFLNRQLSDDEIKTGVSFASAGSGIDDLTTMASGVIPVSRQPLMFNNYKNRLKSIVGDEEANKTISNALILISAGTNDFIFNWYDIRSRRLQFHNITGYQDFLQQRLRNLLMKLYHLGGRKFIVAGLPPIGCLPFQITAKFKNPLQRACIEEQNSDATIYNAKLKNMLLEIQSSLSGSRFIYGGIYDLVIDMVNHPEKYGFVDTNKGCCGTGFLEMGPLCNIFTPPCVDASKFLFWDAVHPTEAAYKVLSKYLLELLPALY
ncbi:GDSL esterase/lipase At2g24560-like [Magnolia sinica]|uniref:GDSL esterase/lipase At2g24560-like n=1 Tax=Magnolia sinica TaxID=86752 RepID=UPI002659F113|nr:GDSL esterase/lipase At2g24560-like [Magnolia sinica]